MSTRSTSFPSRLARLGLGLLLPVAALAVIGAPPAQAGTPSGSGGPTGLHSGMMPADSPDAAPSSSTSSTSSTPTKSSTSATTLGGSSVQAAGGIVTGPDVASYQHPNGAAIDWGQVAANGQSFAIVKAVELYTGSTGPVLYTNPNLHNDLSGAQAAGLVVGAYAFAHPENSPIDQADAFANAVGPLPAGSLPPVLDLEVTGGLSVSQLVQWTHAFLDRLQLDTGIVPMIYTSPSFWANYMGGSTAFGSYPLWEAHYTWPTPAAIAGWSTYSLWQFTSSASIPGISGSVDESQSNTTPVTSLARRAAPSSMATPGTLGAGQYLASPDGQYRLSMQSDGNLVEYGNGGAMWSTQTWGHTGARAVMQSDGNLVVYDASGAALWSTGTWGAGQGVTLSVRDDGNVALSNPAAAIVWKNGAPGSDRLLSGASLTAGQYLTSANGQYRLAMQSDGNLVQYGNGGAMWSAQTWGHGGAHAVLQSDGNLVVYDWTGQALWSSATWSAGSGATLTVQSGGDVALTTAAGATAWHDGAPGADRLLNGASLTAGQYLTSPSGQYRLTMQADGDLVESGNGATLWSTNTAGQSGATLAMQTDGNLVLYDASRTALWNTSTWSAGTGVTLSVQDSGGLALTGPNAQSVWQETPAGLNRLVGGGVLAAGQQLDSPDGTYRLTMQTDGNLVDYHGDVAVWSTGTWGHAGARATLQPDGKLVVSDASGQRLWGTSTWLGAATGVVLSMENGGDVSVTVPSTSTAVSGQSQPKVVWHDGAVGPDRIAAPATLAAGDVLASPNGQYRLTMQADGNLVESASGTTLWSSGTGGHTGAHADLLAQGGLVISDASGTVLWSTQSGSVGAGAWFAVQDDGHVTLTAPSGVVLWDNGAPGTDRVTAGAVLTQGQYLHDSSGANVVVMQADGNLVVYRGGVAKWSSGTYRYPGATATLQADGNVVVYDASGVARWSSGTWGSGSGDVLTMQADGNLVLYSSAGRALWNTGTWR